MREGAEIKIASDEMAEMPVREGDSTLRPGVAELRLHPQRLRRRPLIAIQMRGKALHTQFEPGYGIYCHNQQ